MKAALLCIASIILASCDGNVSGIEGAIVDNPDNLNKFHQLLLVVNLVNADNRHIVPARIDSVTLKVNGEKWGVFSSEEVEVADIPTTSDGTFNLTDEEIGYLVIAPYTIAFDSLTTAGEFSAYLNRRLRLAPGDYMCEVSEVQFRDVAGNAVTLRPHIYRSFRVEENVASLFLGTIDVPVK